MCMSKKIHFDMFEWKYLLFLIEYFVASKLNPCYVPRTEGRWDTRRLAGDPLESREPPPPQTVPEDLRVQR